MPDFTYSILSDVGGRHENQDFVLAHNTPSGFVMIVCDGMGGANGGKLASETAARTIANFLGNHKVSEVSINESKYFLKLLKYAVELGNKSVFDISRTNPAVTGMGTTLCLLLLRNDKAYLAHVGDSRIYHISGQHFSHTEDHSRVYELFKIGVLDEEQARVHPESNIITKALGIAEEVEGSYDEVDLSTNDCFVLCTDGIWGVYPEKELISKFTQNTLDLDATCRNIVDEINDHFSKQEGNNDNLSLGIVVIGEIEKDTSADPSDIKIQSDNDGIGSKKQLMPNAETSKTSSKQPIIIFAAILLISLLIVAVLFQSGAFNRINSDRPETAPQDSVVVQPRPDSSN